jgi:hypothetical protein
MITSADLATAIAALEDKRANLAKRACAVNDQIQLAAQHIHELGVQHSALVAEQSAVQQSIEWCQVALFVAGLIEETKTAEVKSNLRIIGGQAR